MFTRNAFALIAIASLAVASQAATIPITNPGFQDTDVGTGWSETVTGWTDEGGANRSLVVYTDDSNIPAIESDQVLILDSRTTPGAVYQQVGTIAADTTYTLGITAGSRSSQPLPDTFEFGLWAGSGTTPVTPLASRDKSDTTGLADNTKASQVFSIDWDSTGNPSVGANLFVRMAATTDSGPTTAKQVIFDDLSLTSVGPPQVQNPGFESPDTSGFRETTPDSWTWQAAAGNVATAWLVDDTEAWAPSAPDPEQWLLLDARDAKHGDGYLYQYVGDISGGTEYDWSVWMGTRSDSASPANTPFTMGLYTTSDGTPGNPTVALDAKTAADLNFAGDMADYTHQFASSWIAPVGNDGDALYVRIGVDATGTEGHQFFFDDLSLTVGGGAPQLTLPTDPANGEQGVSLDADLVAGFTEAIFTNDAGSIVITNTSGNTLFEAIPIGDTDRVTIVGSTLTIDPAGTFASNTAYAVLIGTNALKNTAGTLFAGITNVTTWAFDTTRPTIDLVDDNGTSEGWNTAGDWSDSLTPSSDKDYIVGANTTAGTNYRLLRSVDTTAADTFLGGSLEITDASGSGGVRGGLLLKGQSGNTAAVSGVFTLSGGDLFYAPDNDNSPPHSSTFAVNSFSVSGNSDIVLGTIAADLTIGANLTGSGHLYLVNQAESQSSDTISFTGISSFAGAITLGANSAGSIWSGTGDLTLDLGTSNYTFQDALTIVGDSILQVNAGQTLTFTNGGLVDPVNGTVTGGTYTTAALGANYTGAGTIVVGSAEGTIILFR